MLLMCNGFDRAISKLKRAIHLENEKNPAIVDVQDNHVHKSFVYGMQEALGIMVNEKEKYEKKDVGVVGLDRCSNPSVLVYDPDDPNTWTYEQLLYGYKCMLEKVRYLREKYEC